YTCKCDQMTPQVSLYIDKPLYMEIKSIAEKRNTSISRVVNGMIQESIDNSWPEGYFDLFGSIDDETFKVPEELPWSLDTPRDPL
ncbi:MAG: hypothetical protein LBI08_02530, partial [Methanomassiliicoccaceae archaeon]|nr:hypothetical protein [Methanomassiliicoccaceae archaeon]